jgi:hypothetical protein
MYSATKHAVKAFTDALRMEVEAEGLPVSITLIKPAATDTPYAQHAKSYLKDLPVNPSPLYSPDVVARTILHCAEVPRAEVIVGGVGKLLSLAGRYAPRFRDILYERIAFRAQHSGKPGRAGQPSSLEHASNELRERGGEAKTTFESSLYTQAALHPVLSGIALVGGGVVLASAIRRLARSSQSLGEAGQLTHGKHM